ncbi:hypothetical protein TSUD_129880 [Trifolium subterraneum]|uniref:Uncharacterized protein n=1 Tax=Trifolium subterraneum TaxID=3900 RepID=A0A2Z6NWW9_TRISU|nr:hypothetical protein TSUD_129880 [Trifolium subterraneum]
MNSASFVVPFSLDFGGPEATARIDSTRCRPCGVIILFVVLAISGLLPFLGVFFIVEGDGLFLLQESSVECDEKEVKDNKIRGLAMEVLL